MVLLKSDSWLIAILLAGVILLMIAACNRQPDESILAQIGDKEISVQAFLQRSELTIRPNNFKDKHTTLNNLIAEKILALEAERERELLKNPNLHLKLTGIKEQLMRDKLYYKVAYNRVSLDSGDVARVYQLSMRRYDLEFFTVSDQALAQRIQTVIDSDPGLTDEMFKEVVTILGKRPLHQIKYDDPEDELVHQSLFTHPVQPGAVIGPLRLANGDYIIMKVLRWIDYPLVGSEEQQIRWNKVKKKLHRMRAGKLWRTYQANMMHGKKIVFDKQSFAILLNLAQDIYVVNQERNTWEDYVPELSIDDVKIDSDAPFFTIDDQSWTIGDFKNELIKHPLVFRTKHLTHYNFHEQFKLAIVDMMRDHYLTQEAYNRSLDNADDINKSIAIWQDAYLASKQKSRIINAALDKGIINNDDKLAMLKYWNAYLSSLQNEYGDLIHINHQLLDAISLTDIDFAAVRPGVPYPIAVPGFPVLISSADLSYAKEEGLN
jgi:hypothetical protein